MQRYKLSYCTMQEHEYGNYSQYDDVKVLVAALNEIEKFSQNKYIKDVAADALRKVGEK